MRYEAVKIENLEGIWPEFMRFIEDSLDDSWGILDIEKMLFKGDATLWIAYNGSPKASGVTWFEHFPKQKDLVMAFAGGEMEAIKGLVKIGEQYAKANDCDGIRCYGRRGWSRSLDGYKEISTISRKVI